jgi:hypothetical protein
MRLICFQSEGGRCCSCFGWAGVGSCGGGSLPVALVDFSTDVEGAVVWFRWMQFCYSCSVGWHS